MPGWPRPSCAEGVDALVVVNSSNIRYLTGFAGTAGVLVVTAGCLYLLVDFRYSSAVARLVRDGVAPPALVPVSLEGSAGYDRRLAELVAAEGWSRVGFEDAHVSVQRARQWGELFAAAGTQAALVGVTDAVERPRLVKDAGEIETLREAGRLLSAVAVDVLEHVIRAGRTELEMAADIDWRVKRAGFEKPAFDTIVASGPNSALPHARPTARRAEAGELVVVDFGGMLRGYAVDLTRTVGLGPVPDEARRIYEAVLEAQAGGDCRRRAARGDDRRGRRRGPRHAGPARPRRRVRPRDGTRTGARRARGPASQPAVGGGAGHGPLGGGNGLHNRAGRVCGRHGRRADRGRRGPSRRRLRPADRRAARLAGDPRMTTSGAAAGRTPQRRRGDSGAHRAAGSDAAGPADEPSTTDTEPDDSMNVDAIKQILDLVREHELTEFELEQGGVKLRVKKQGAAPPAPAPAAPQLAPLPVPALAPVAAAPAAARGRPRRGPAEEPLELSVVTSPIVGTFYRSPEPGVAVVRRGRRSGSRRARCSASSKR